MECCLPAPPGQGEEPLLASSKTQVLPPSLRVRERHSPTGPSLLQTNCSANSARFSVPQFLLCAWLTRLTSQCLSFSNYKTVMVVILPHPKHLVTRCWAGAMRSDQCLRVLVAPPPSLILRHMMSTPSATLGRK